MDRTKRINSDGRIASSVADKTLMRLIGKLQAVQMSLTHILALQRNKDGIRAVVGLTEHYTIGLAR